MGMAGLRSYGSALRKLWVDAKRRPPEWLEKDITVFFGGLERIAAEHRQTGLAKAVERKEATKFEDSRTISREAPRRNTPDSSPFHSLLTLTWNLMCRAKHHFKSDSRLSQVGWGLHGGCCSVERKRTKLVSGPGILAMCLRTLCFQKFALC
eukprot:Plantae.Rhodophyta-Rhodochaete_pulchella.ctg74304.p2 GENE.Plantae.Rhodophyta-Rhodochaete_pulchella.ctg74304~~Plantae.Rhodophyta-Rhodochaete_pulchella.ctg74304.p2  ORF type:complete len:152 (+),score=7.24 Plantae.Rhodophyta-Rhodochaete_pulchella.ctg74304:403-858(+)